MCQAGFSFPRLSCGVKSMGAKVHMTMSKKLAQKAIKVPSSRDFTQRARSGWVPWGATLLLVCSLAALGAARPGELPPESARALAAPETSAAEVALPALPACRPCEEVVRLGEARQILASTPAMAEPLLVGLFRDALSQDVLVGAAKLLVEASTADWPKGDRGGFLRALAPLALVAGRTTGIPPSITLAQAILESGWGRSSLAREDNNLFGVKTGASTSGSVAALTREGRGRITTARFRTYADWRESLLDHNQLLASDRRYAKARLHLDDWRAFLVAMAPTYATSRTYVPMVSGLVESYGLDRWDALVHEVALAGAAEDVLGAALASRD